jgi:hypothetical protein
MDDRNSNLLKAAALALALLGRGVAAAAEPGTAYAPDSRNIIYEEEPKILWLAPRIAALVDRARWVRIAKGTVIAEETVAIAEARLTNDAAIALPATLGGPLPPGTQFVRRLKGAAEDACLIRGGRSAGEAAIQVCLADSDGDGRYDAAHRGAEPVAIAPVRLRPPPALESGITTVRQRLVVTRIEHGRVTLSGDYIIEVGGNFCSVGMKEKAPGSRARHRVDTLMLRNGRSARIEGLRVKASKGANGDWWVNARGIFRPWARLDRDGTLIDAGGIIDCVR